ncbi:MAG: hypothetical protein GJ680_07660 [Alteromonadaceae bacterium]|nr:hypothetical protein [Alteromonadaceae bacterium]
MNANKPNDETIFYREYLFNFLFPDGFSYCASLYLHGFSIFLHALGVRTRFSITEDSNHIGVKFGATGNAKHMNEVEKLFLIYLQLPAMNFKSVVSSNPEHQIIQKVIEGLVCSYEYQFNQIAEFFKLHNEECPADFNLILTSLLRYDDNISDNTNIILRELLEREEALSVSGKSYSINEDFVFYRNEFPLSKAFNVID